jgi:iron complex outermembrane recepter protein
MGCRAHEIGKAFACAVGLSFAGLSIAQTDTTENVATLQEVVVTAQKRAERLQDVPISVAALSGASLEGAQVNDVVDLGARFANLAMPDTGSKGQNILLRIRGFGNNNATRTLRAGIIVDDVPYLSPRGLNAGLFDIDQAQVLRGPQSSLYGLTAEAGLVIINSIKPDLDAARGRLALQYDSDNEYSLNGRYSIPIVPGKFAAALSATAAGGEGWIDNIVSEREYNKTQSGAARLQALAQLTDSLILQFAYAREEVDDDVGLTLVPIDRAAFNAEYGTSLRRFQSAADYAGFVKNTDESANVTVRWKLASSELVAVTAFRDFETLPSFDIDLGPEPVQLGPFTVLSGQPNATTRAFSQELRLQSSGESALTWTAGAFFYSTKDTSFSTATIIAPFEDEFTIGPLSTDDYESRAVFGQVAYEWANGLSAAFGARFEDVELENREDGIERSARYDDSEFLPKLTVGYAFDDDTRLYASAGRGWLAGGVFVGETAEDDTPYLPEKSTTYEVGFKGAWLDGRLATNVALFQTKVDDYQESIRTSLITAETSNAGEVEFKGVELELSARLSNTLSARASLGISKAEYSDFVEFDPESELLVNRAGNRVPGVAERDYEIAMTYRNAAGWYVTGEFSGSGDILETKDTLNSLPAIDGYDVANLRAGYDADRWSVGLYCNNVGNKEYFTYGNDQLGDGVVFGALGRKRHFGLSFQYRFER